jgi:hypothetical protein
MGKFAANTSVSAEKSRAEIESVLRRYGANGFQYGWADREGKQVAQIDFSTNDRHIRFHLILPSVSDRQFWFTDSRGKRRSEQAAHAAWEQACRQRWRALLLCIKAKLEAVECGISEFEEEFLAHIVDPITGQTFGRMARPIIADRYAGIASNLKFPALPAPKEAEESEIDN